MKLIRKQVYITQVQALAIKRLAQRQKISESAIMRIALEQFFVKEGMMDMQDPFADLIGMFEGPAQVYHDDVYHWDRS